jgi:hypothetical protein
MKRYTEAEKRAILDELGASGQSRAEFCRTRGLCYGSVGAWSKERGLSSAPAGFVEVSSDDISVSSAIEVWLPQSICVRFSAGTAISELADFCREVSKC